MPTMAGLRWVELGEQGTPYPAAVRALRHRSGVYAIRRVGLLFTRVLYVGESHTGALYATLTRHFQGWHRDKKWWRGQYSAVQTDPGHTYDRSAVEVAWEVSATRAIELQDAWIAALKPEDNRAGVVDGREAAPF